MSKWRVANPLTVWPLRAARQRLRPAILGGLAQRASQAVVALALPPRCLWCQADDVALPDGVLLCAACQQLLIGTVHTRCVQCGSIVSTLVTQTCLHCQGDRPRFDRVVTLGAYAGELRRGILQLKSAGHESLALALGRLLTLREKDALQAAQAEAVLPVPMHWTRRLVRRTNSAEQLAAAVAAQLNLPQWHRSLRRVRVTRKQGPLLRTERTRNVRGAFRMNRDFDVRGKRLIVVDDILTTGATCHEVAKVLKRAGAAAVTVAVLARADMHR